MPPPTLPQSPQPHVHNFYEHGFRQLSGVQQKQVGLLVGAAVADAAARGMEGRSAEDVARYEREALAFDQAHEEEMRLLTANPKAPAPPPQQPLQDVHSPLVFSRAEGFASSSLSSSSSSTVPSRRTTPHGTAQPLAFHSFSYHLLYDVLRTMGSAHGEFPLHYVAKTWVESARAVAAVDAEGYLGEVGSLLHALCTLLPIPVLYPYASDAVMREYAAPFVDMLTEVPLSPEEAGRTVELAAGTGDAGRLTATVAEVHAAEKGLAMDITLSALGVVIRALRDCADPERNGALMAIPGTADMFTEDSAAFVPPLTDQTTAEAMSKRRAINEAVFARFPSSPSSPSSSGSPSLAAAGSVGLLPRRPVLRDAATIKESLAIAKGARSFAHGVVQAVRRGGPVCQRAMLVGAMLGAKLGVRQVPLPWLSATVDHQPVATMAIEVAQWTWNPPHH